MNRTYAALLLLAAIPLLWSAATTLPTGNTPAIEVLAEVPSASISAHRPGKGLPVWTHDGARLLYIGADNRLMRLSLSEPDRTEALGDLPIIDAILGPDADSVICVAPRPGDGKERRPMTLLLHSGASAPIDLLPGELAVHGVTTVKAIHRWVAPPILAFSEHVGTGASELFLLDVEQQALLPTPRLAATDFLFSPDGQRVAGQWWGGPPFFWLYDLTAGRETPTDRLPGEHQYFESWSDDGEAILFTAWEGGWPYQGGRATLYRLHLADGRLEALAKDAALATWSGDTLAYVTMGPELTLVVTEASTGSELWREGLGPRDQVPEAAWESLRPTIFGPYLSYRKVDHTHWVSPIASKKPMWLHTGERALLSWAPDSRHVAIIADEPEPRLRVVRNPHLAQEESDRFALHVTVLRKDEPRGERLAGAEVSIDGTGMVATTDLLPRPNRVVAFGSLPGLCLAAGGRGCDHG